MREIHVVCGVALKGGEVFMARRRPEKAYGGFWELPGGKVEPGESHEQALARELAEELKIDVKVGDYIATGVDEQEGLKIVLHGYLIGMQSEPVESSDHDKLGWKSVEDLKELNIPPADHPILETTMVRLKAKRQ